MSKQIFPALKLTSAVLRAKLGLGSVTPQLVLRVLRQREKAQIRTGPLGCIEWSVELLRVCLQVTQTASQYCVNATTARIAAGFCACKDYWVRTTRPVHFAFGISGNDLYHEMFAI